MNCPMPRELMVKQYVAVVRSRLGQRFMVFETGDDKFYLFVPMIGESSIFGTIHFPVRKANLRDDIKHSLRAGVGNSI